ncbi:nucleoside triphosphate pyrophosphohydrolase family protein [Candidatus Saccharibacteria bacterium]|nr:nucleoside triphosphate pyrophosphohydrolase family protein [Candidatus Saccharibacteria bacterium]
MTFDEYQKLAKRTWYPPAVMAEGGDDFRERAQTVAVLGISGEAGEIVEKWKKVIQRYEGFEMTPELVADFKKELGDVLWYMAIFADGLGLSFDEVAKKNIAKLSDRQKRKVLLKGAGDNR